MNSKTRFFKKRHALLIALALPNLAFSCPSNNCLKSQTTFYGENAITSALATALNNELSNATNFNEIIQMTREISQLNVLIMQKDEFIHATNNKLKELEKTSSLKESNEQSNRLKLIELIKESTKSKNALIAELQAVKNAQNKAQERLKEEKSAHEKTVRDLTNSNKSMASKVDALENHVLETENKSKKDRLKVQANIKELKSILKENGVATADKDQPDSFTTIIAGVKKLVENNNHKSSYNNETGFNTEQLESISEKMKELQSKLQASLVSGSFTEQLYYITSDYKLRSAELKYTNQIFKFASKYKNIDVFITGRADPRGSISYNQKLAANRARFVEQLAIKNGIPQDRIHVTSHITDSQINENSELHFFDRNTTVVIKRRM